MNPSFLCQYCCFYFLSPLSGVWCALATYHEERKQRSQRKTNSIPLLKDLIISTGGSDQYLALVNKLNSKSITSNTSSKLAIEPESSDVIEKLEPSEILGREEGEGEQFESDLHKNRSKSWHCFPEDTVYCLSQENLSGFEDKHDLSSKGAVVGSRSFHTVEEYVDMVNRIWLTKSQVVQQIEFNNEEEVDGLVIKTELQVSESSSDTTHHTEDNDSAIKKMQPPSLNKNYPLEEREIVKEEVVQSHKQRLFESDSQGVSNIEKGNKRKAIAKRLESLRIPSNIESPAIASLREWLPADGIYSPGSYFTPKFGSYSLMNTRYAKDSIFSPELVSSFEQCMQKLEAEEENILKQIIKDVEEESDEGMQTQERTPVLHHV